MKIEQNLLIENLLALTNEATLAVQQFKTLPLAQLNTKPDTRTWSILECIEHLNLYGNFYLPEIETCLIEANPIEGNHAFKSSFIGDYFVSQIKAENMKKLKATQEMDSTGSRLNITAIDQFLKQLGRLTSLLKESKKVSLNKVKTRISLTTLFKLRLGDTLRFLVYHNERHILQASRLLERELERS